MSLRLFKLGSVLTLLSTLVTASISYAYVAGRPAPSALAGTIRIGPLGASCSGVVVAGRFVVTAAHCNMKGQLNSGLAVTLTSALETPNETVSTHQILNFQKHPVLTGLMHGSEVADIAVLEFEDLSEFSSMLISPHAAQNNESIVVGGYGCQAKRDLGTETLRVAPKKVEPEEGGLVTVFATGLMDADQKNQSIACNGDSGGPAFRWNSSKNRFEVVGVNHALMPSLTAIKGVGVDPQTGRINSIYGENPRTLIMRIAPDPERDPYHILQWLRSVLPAEAFAD